MRLLLLLYIGFVFGVVFVCLWDASLSVLVWVGGFCV